jgi:hypothetical protein
MKSAYSDAGAASVVAIDPTASAGMAGAGAAAAAVELPGTAVASPPPYSAN